MHAGVAAVPIGRGLPLGRYILVNGQVFHTEDHIGYGSDLDLWTPSCKTAYKWGRRRVTVYIFGRGAVPTLALAAHKHRTTFRGARSMAPRPKAAPLWELPALFFTAAFALVVCYVGIGMFARLVLSLIFRRPWNG